MFFKNKNCISMIPYPSGKIHIGHVRNYLINDIYNRFLKFNTMHSNMFMSWDSFGTPAENASLFSGIYPLKFLNSNIFYMKKQLNFNDFSINWNKEFKTFEHNYYYFNQLFFSKIIKNKILYISNKKNNWDDCDKTVLSNEQIINGRGWRSSCLIKKKNISTYYFKIKRYRLEILKEIENLNWPEKIKIMQNKWILNKIFLSFFFFFFFNLKLKKKIFLKNFFFFFFLSKLSKLKKFFLNFKFKKKLNKSFFIKTFLNDNFEIILKNNSLNFKKKNFFFFFFFKINIFLNKFFKYLSFFELFNFFKKKKYITFRLKWNIKDWGISRQRYWGTPIPSFFCKFCKKYYLISNKKYPILIFKNLKKNKFFYFKKINKIKCFFCNKNSFKEIFTMDTFIDSSWYFLKYQNNRKYINYNTPIDLYIGGVEHSILHLLYSRYIIKILRDYKYLNFGEPFKKIFTQGMILYKTELKNIFKIEKMSKSKNNIIIPEKIILKYNKNSLRISLLKNSLNKDLLWEKNLICWSCKIIKNFEKIINYKRKKFKKEKFFQNFFLFYNFKIFVNFLNKNFKKNIYFLKNLNYNNLLIFLIKLFKDIKKIIFLKIFNIFILKNIFFKLLKFLYFLIPFFSNKLWFILKFYSILNIKKVYINNILNIFYNKDKIFKKSIILKNKNIGKIFYNKLIKKKIINFIFFKKKIKKIFVKKIININFLINILYYEK